MDLSWLVSFLILVVILSVGYVILKYLIMPVVPAAAQPIVWAVIGLILLIALILFFGAGHFGHLGIR
jgi:hypothetical protein